jgi:hypothetical protein
MFYQNYNYKFDYDPFHLIYNFKSMIIRQNLETIIVNY